MAGYPCCCEECVEGEEPTADFSYEQTGDDPCTISLTDESTVHANCDGEIVEHRWYKNDETTPFSTDANPTDVEVEDGDDIRHWVKDSCGCTDEATMAIECEDTTQTFTCAGHTFTLPTFMDVAFPSISNGTCTCAGLGGTRRLKLNNTTVTTRTCPAGSCCFVSYGRCQNDVQYPIDTGGLCAPLGTGWTLAILIPTDGTSDIIATANVAIACTSGSATVDWQKTNIPWTDNLTTFNQTLPFAGPSGSCGGTAGTNAVATAV